MSTPPCATHQAGLHSLFSSHSVQFYFVHQRILFCFPTLPVPSFPLSVPFFTFSVSHFSTFSFSHVFTLSVFFVFYGCLILLPPCTRVPHYFHIPTFCLNLFSLSISSFCFPLYLRYTSVNHCKHDLSFCIDIVATNTTQIYGSSNFYCSSTA